MVYMVDQSLNSLKNGAVAQLGERSVRNGKVTGSIPVGSTIYIIRHQKPGKHVAPL